MKKLKACPQIFLLIFALSVALLCPKTAHAAPQPTPTATAPAYTLPPALLAKAKTLGRMRNILAFGGTAWTIFALIVVLALRWPVALRNLAERVTERRWLQGLIFLPIAILFLVLLPLPLEIYSHHIGRAYGLSVQPWGNWASDQFKNLLLSLAVFTPLLLLLFRIIRRQPRRWWLWFWLCAIPIIVLAVFIAPIWIDPMFNHFSPLQQADPQLTAKLEQLARHAGLDIPPSRMFLMQASAKVTGLNAYVTGIGASKRIVVWDNTIHRLPTDEILFIVGHEMGHYVLRHIYKGLLFTAAVLFFGLWIVAIAARWLIRRFGARWHIRAAEQNQGECMSKPYHSSRRDPQEAATLNEHEKGDGIPGFALDDWAALAVLVLVATCIGFLLSPIDNSFSRWEEHQADIFGQEAIHGLVPDPQQTAVKAFNALGRAYLEVPNPNPWVEFWLDNHPSTSQRANFAEHYDPWLPGKRPKYFRR